jgi:hypothetical protein
MAKQQALYSAEQEQQLMLEIWSPEVANDPRNFVRLMYPWNKPNTPLDGIKGPRDWQDRILLDIAEYIRDSGNTLRSTQNLPAMFKAAVASGRGIGKSALFGWLAHWMVSTRLGSSCWVAANSEAQLRTKTFAEIAKWVSMGLNAHWWEIQTMSIKPAEWFSDAVKRDLKIDPGYWAIQGQLWSEEAPDAFAGAHNVYGEMALFDEASGIPSAIWTVQQGVFTEKIIDRYWLGFSNPRRNSGSFFECFHKNRDDWRQYQIDARTVEGIPADAYSSIIKEHGPDSDEARIEVYGQFPNQGSNQFIGKDAAYEAAVREIIPDPGAPLLMGVDVARFGEDKSVIAWRKGRDARVIPWQKFKGIDTVKLAGIVADLAAKYNPQAIFVDGNGVGGGVVDVLKSWGYKVVEVQMGGSPQDGDTYINKRVEIWGRMREWLTTGAIPNDTALVTDLISPEYSYHPVSNKIQLEGKDKMKSRGLASPDAAEALAMTFSSPVARLDAQASRNNSLRNRTARDVDYAIFG